MLTYGYPLMLGNLMLLILSLSDRFLIKNFGDDTMLGLYSFGSKFGNIFNVLIIGPFSLAWIPLRWKIYERPDGKEVFSIFNRFFLVFSPLIACSFCFILPLFIDLITVDKEYLKGLSIMSFALVSQVFFGLNYFNHMGFLFKEKTQMIMGITFISASINIILNMFLIKKIGFIGAGISAMIAYFVLFLITRIISQKIYPIKRKISLELFQIIVLFILGFSFPIILDLLDNLYLLSVIFLIFFFVLVSINFVFGYLSFEDLKLLKKTIFKPHLDTN
jgi:O-antigen/teichoic acid export membrane protein